MGRQGVLLGVEIESLSLFSTLFVK